MTSPFRENKNPCKRGFCQCRRGTACRGWGMHAAPVCRVNLLVGRRFHLPRAARHATVRALTE
jgi:hypothetical protein